MPAGGCEGDYITTGYEHAFSRLRTRLLQLTARVWRALSSAVLNFFSVRKTPLHFRRSNETQSCLSILHVSTTFHLFIFSQSLILQNIAYLFIKRDVIIKSCNVCSVAGGSIVNKCLRAQNILHF